MIDASVNDFNAALADESIADVVPLVDVLIIESFPFPNDNDLGLLAEFLDL